MWWLCVGNDLMCCVWVWCLCVNHCLFGDLRSSPLPLLLSCLQIPLPSVPTLQPPTVVPERLEAIQRYIRDLQYPFNFFQMAEGWKGKQRNFPSLTTRERKFCLLGSWAEVGDEVLSLSGNCCFWQPVVLLPDQFPLVCSLNALPPSLQIRQSWSVANCPFPRTTSTTFKRHFAWSAS